VGMVINDWNLNNVIFWCHTLKLKLAKCGAPSTTTTADLSSITQKIVMQTALFRPRKAHRRIPSVTCAKGVLGARLLSS